jgi:chromosome segregation ATPase
MSLRRAAVLLPLLLAAGCATPNCDPRNAGFFDGLGNEASGCYARNQQRQEQELAAARADLARQRAATAAAQADAAAATRDLAAMQERLNAVAAESHTMRGRIAAARARQNADLAAVQRAQDQVDALARDVSRARAAPNPAAVQELERRRQELLRTTQGL